MRLVGIPDWTQAVDPDGTMAAWEPSPFTPTSSSYPSWRGLTAWWPTDCGTCAACGPPPTGKPESYPKGIAHELFGGDDATIEHLIRAGLWEATDDGYRMLRGPSSDPDQPLPLWRYSDDDLDGRLFARDDTPNT